MFDLNNMYSILSEINNVLFYIDVYFIFILSMCTSYRCLFKSTRIILKCITFCHKFYLVGTLFNQVYDFCSNFLKHNYCKTTGKTVNIYVLDIGNFYI